MSGLIHIKSHEYNFYIDGRNIYFLYNNQKSFISTFDNLQLPASKYAELVDCIYRRKIKNTDTFNEHLFSKYRLNHTDKKL